MYVFRLFEDSWSYFILKETVFKDHIFWGFEVQWERDAHCGLWVNGARRCKEAREVQEETVEAWVGPWDIYWVDAEWQHKPN